MKWLDKFNNGGVQPNYNDANVSLPPNFKGYGYNKSGNSKNGSWDGPVTKMGGMIPGATGMMYSNNFQVNEKKPNTKKYQKGGVERKLPLTPLYSPVTNNSNSFDFGDPKTRPFKTNIPDEEYDRRKTQSVLEKTFGKDFHVLNYLPNQNLQSESDKYPLQTFIRYNLGISNEPEYLPLIKEVQDIRGQYLKADPFGPAGPENSKVDFEKAVKDKGARQFLERYNDPVTRKRLKEQAGMTDYDIDNFIIRGLTAKKTVTNNFRWDAGAMYDGDKHEILIRPNKSNAVETHERVHASALDNVMGKVLSKIVGNAFLQKESNNFTEIKNYMNRPHETYGNFSEFRERLGLKPGEQINIKELERRVKKLGLERDHFYNTYDKDKVLKALNTIALNDNLPIQNIAQRGKTIPFKDPDHPFTDKNLFEQFGVLPILETPILESTDRNLTIKDPRKILATSQKPIRPNFDNVSGNYNSYHLDELINEAKKSGMSKDDIWNLTAMGFQETKWGKTDENIGHVLDNFTNAKNDYQNFINAYKVKQKEANRLGYTSPEMRLQMYNGMGMIKPETEEDYHGFKMKKIYGVDIPPEGISMKKNPLYGKQIIDIRDNVLKKNPGFVKYMDSIQKAPIMFGSDYIEPLHPVKLQDGDTISEDDEKRILDYIQLMNMQTKPKGSIRASDTKQTKLSKVKEVALNPLTAMSYIAQNKDIPDNFSRGPRNTLDYALDVINPAQYVEDSKNVVQGSYEGNLGQVGEGLLGVVPMMLEAKNIVKGVDKLGNKYLPNARKLNPFEKTAESFNNPNSFYRQIDNVTYDEGVKSGLIKGKQDIGYRGPESGAFNLNKSFGDDAYYNKGSLYSPQRADYIYEVKKGEEAFIPKVNNRTRGYTTENTSVRVSKEPIPLEEATIYKKDWLQGYKPIEVPKSTSNFKSEIDWGKWNKEIPDNPTLLKEYHDIEKAAKKSGTWMKNPDGSVFKGTPEQFVQLNSQNFKKSGLDNEFLYHSTKDDFNKFTFDKFNSNSQSQTKKVPATYLSNNKLVAEDFLFEKPGKIMQVYSGGKAKVIDNTSNFTKSKLNIQELKDSGVDKFVVKNTLDVNPPAALKRVIEGVGNKQYKSDIHGIFNNQMIKSAIGNNGMFDMTNPNIYKAMLPIGLGLGAASQLEEEPVPGMKQGGVIKDDRGQWAHPGEITEIGSNQITMQGVPYPVLGISDTGDTQMMYPEEEYEFDGEKVTEFPMAKNGIRQEQKSLVNLDQLTNFTNYNTPQPGGWLDKY